MSSARIFAPVAERAAIPTHVEREFVIHRNVAVFGLLTLLILLIYWYIIGLPTFAKNQIKQQREDQAICLSPDACGGVTVNSFAQNVRRERTAQIFDGLSYPSDFTGRPRVISYASNLELRAQSYKRVDFKESHEGNVEIREQSNVNGTIFYDPNDMEVSSGGTRKFAVIETHVDKYLVSVKLSDDDSEKMPHRGYGVYRTPTTFDSVAQANPLLLQSPQAQRESCDRRYQALLRGEETIFQPPTTCQSSKKNK